MRTSHVSQVGFSHMKLVNQRKVHVVEFIFDKHQISIILFYRYVSALQAETNYLIYHFDYPFSIVCILSSISANPHLSKCSHI